MRTRGTLLLVVAVAVVYANGLSGPFVFDDQGSIVENPHLRRLWPPGAALAAPPQATVAGRPLVSLSLALNYAVSGLDVRGYHLFNITIHVLNALLVRALVRRTLTLPAAAPWGAARSESLALATALVWAVHPLVSETVDYVSQRTESLMALCYLVTLNGAARSLASASRGSGIVAVGACWAGMACKEAMVTAPLAVVLYDLAYAGEALGALARRRFGLWLGLCSSWLLLAALIWTGPRSETVGFGLGVGAWDYARSQASMLVDYLRTALWPAVLVADYGYARPVPPGVGVGWALPFALGLAALCGIAYLRRPAWGFPALFALLVLAPTSSFVPIVSEVGAERRMYLPLAALVGLALAASAKGLEAVGARRLSSALVALGVVALGARTYMRNEDYRDPVRLWRTAVDARPANPRAHNNLGHALHLAGRPAEALEHYRRALELDPDYAQAHFNAGVAWAELGHAPLAIASYREALRLNPRLAMAHVNLASELANRGALAEAMDHFRAAVQCAPEWATARARLGRAERLAGSTDRAIVELDEALRLDPDGWEAASDLAWILATDPDPARRDGARALRLARRAVALDGGRHALALDGLAAAQAEAGDFAGAEETAARAQALAERTGASVLASEIEARRAGYRLARPYREPPANGAGVNLDSRDR